MPERHESAAIIQFWQAKVFRRNGGHYAISRGVFNLDEKKRSSAGAD
jgi:hypothetical protein